MWGIDMKTREEIEKEIKDCEQSLKNYYERYKQKTISLNFYKENATPLRTTVNVLEWVLGDCK